MVKINENFLSMKKNYLFIDIAKRIKAFSEANPDKTLIRMGIGDVTQPIAPVAVEAMKKAADEMGQAETFRGYEDSGAGYDFLREAVSGYYKSFGVDVPASDIRINDGAKSDCGNIVDIFGDGNTILVTDPAYPVYVDSNMMAGREVIYADSDESNGFASMPDYSVHADIIYLCSPNNPTGACYDKNQLKIWVDYANEHGSVILFDSAYEVFVCADELPRTIFEIDGSKTCAIEIASLSKTAGFTGTRCSYTIVPKELVRDNHSLKDMWNRRQSTKFNGTPYIVQRAAEAVFTDEGYAEIMENIHGYQHNAKIITDTLDKLGIYYTGGHYSPYVWLKCPNNMSSWEFFDFLLENAQVVGTPGEGFGSNGEGFFRLTAFNTPERTSEAMDRLKNLLK